VSQLPPPASVVSAVERFSPGFWSAWNRAVGSAWQRTGGFQVTSWWRSPERNREVGGSDVSQHLLGVAFDVLPRTSRVYQGLRSAGFQVIDEGDHLHVQPWPAGAARPILRSIGWA